MTEKFDSTITNYWNYYIELEREIFDIKKYVEFNERNYKCFSIEFLKLYQAICSEIDSLGKCVASILDNSFNPNNKQNNLFKWWYVVSNNLFLHSNFYNGKLINIKDYTVRNFILNVEFSPWENFIVEYRTSADGRNYPAKKEGCETPKWRSDYNKVKHNRTSFNKENCINYEAANLKNVLLSLSALYSLEHAILELTGTKDDLEGFINNSIFFTTNKNMTTKDLDEILI